MLTVPRGAFESFAFSPNGEFLVSGHADGVIRVWDPRRAAEMASLRLPHIICIGSDVVVSPNSRWVAVQSYNQIALYEWNGTELVLKWVASPYSLDQLNPDYHVRVDPQLSDFTGGLAFSPESDAIVTLWRQEGLLGVLPIDDGEMIRLRCRTGRARVRVKPFAISAGGVVATLSGHTVTLWSWSRFSPKGHYRPLAGLTHSMEVSDFAFSADGSRLVTTAYQTLRVWDIETRQCLNRIKASNRTLTVMAASPDGRLALTCTKDRIISLWELETGKEVSRFQFRIGKPYQLAFAPDGLTAVVRNATCKLLQWDIDV